MVNLIGGIFFIVLGIAAITLSIVTAFSEEGGLEILMFPGAVMIWAGIWLIIRI